MKKKITIISTIIVLTIISSVLLLKNNISISAQDNKELIVLPPKLYAITGQELNIYFDNIINGKDNDYDFTVTCNIGGQFNYYYRVVPEKIGQYPIKIQAYKNGEEVGSVSSQIIVTDRMSGKNVNKSLLIIGDSTTANGICTQKLLDDFGKNEPMNITLLGTKGKAPNLNEGISGWKVNDYYSTSGMEDKKNTFWNEKTKSFDFTYYMNKQGYKNTDYVIINLGINDTFPFTDDDSLQKKTDEMISQYNGIIDSIHKFNSKIIIGVAITIPPAHDQNSFGKMYGCIQTQWRYKRNNFLWTKTIIQNYSEKENDNIYLVPINTNLDTRNNMGIEYTQVNARNSKKIPTIIGNGSVHPKESGYWQIADVYWYWIKSFEE